MTDGSIAIETGLLVSDDPAMIRGWAAEILSLGLHRGVDGVAQGIFQDSGRIRRMAYLPGIAWAMECDHRNQNQVFTHPDYRHRGVCARLVEALWPGRWPGVFGR